MWCRPDARLRHVYYFLPFEVSLQTPDRSSSIFYWDLGRTTARLPFHLSCSADLNAYVCITNLLMCIMFAFVISHVQTILRVHSKYSPGLLIWPDVDEGDLMDEEFDSESDS